MPGEENESKVKSEWVSRRFYGEMTGVDGREGVTRGEGGAQGGIDLQAKP